MRTLEAEGAAGAKSQVGNALVWLRNSHEVGGTSGWEQKKMRSGVWGTQILSGFGEHCRDFGFPSLQRNGVSRLWPPALMSVLSVALGAASKMGCWEQ